jgi:hypothetical protein
MRSARLKMTRLNKEESKLKLTIQILILMAMLVFSFISCKSPESTTTAATTTTVARIIVSNQSGFSLQIYMDGAFQFWMGNEGEAKITDVSIKEHKMEAYREGTNTLYDSTTIDVVEKTDYTWTIDDPPDINVTNNYGQTLKIYMDNVYYFDLVDEENRWLIDVPWGERFLKATRASDNTEVASITISVDANKDYSWTIQ